MFSQAALAEFKMGDAERGRGIFEGILRNYPKRLDLWSIYLDQVTPQHCVESKRDLPICSTSLVNTQQ